MSSICSHDTIPAIWKGREIKDTVTREKLTEYSIVELVETGGKIPAFFSFHMPFTVQGTHHFVIGGICHSKNTMPAARRLWASLS